MARDRLPIDDVLPELLAKIRDAGAVVLRAPTGAGKTTRVAPALAGDGQGADVPRRGPLPPEAAGGAVAGGDGDRGAKCARRDAGGRARLPPGPARNPPDGRRTRRGSRPRGVATAWRLAAGATRPGAA